MRMNIKVGSTTRSIWWQESSVRGASSVAYVSDWSEPGACLCRAYHLPELVVCAHNHTSLISAIIHTADRHVCTSMLRLRKQHAQLFPIQAHLIRTRASSERIRLSHGLSARLAQNYANAGRQL